MTTEEITQGNRLIAEFMGNKFIPNVMQPQKEYYDLPTTFNNKTARGIYRIESKE